MKLKTKFEQNEIGKNKIFNIFLLRPIRCVKKEFYHKNLKFEVYVVKDSPAIVRLGKIIVNNLFFEKFNTSEQIAILYHERYHNKSLTSLKKIFNIIRFLSFKKAKWQEEFDADKYASKNVDKNVVQSLLEKSKKLYEEGYVVYNKKSHPPIDERIKEMLK